MPEEIMRTRINNDDMKHLESFSESQKNVVLRKIMSHPPAKTVVMEGNNHFEKALIRLRRDGYGLIDLQPQETACASVWYRRKPALLRNPRGDVAMLLWETQEQGEATTVITWKV
jgi:hypothetical protein